MWPVQVLRLSHLSGLRCSRKFIGLIAHKKDTTVDTQQTPHTPRATQPHAVTHSLSLSLTLSRERQTHSAPALARGF